MTRDFALASLPEGVELGTLSRRVFDVLAQHTSFPWPIMQAQCRREGVDPTAITPEGLARVVDHLANAVARFTTPQNAVRVGEALRPLARPIAHTG